MASLPGGREQDIPNSGPGKGLWQNQKTTEEELVRLVEEHVTSSFDYRSGGERNFVDAELTRFQLNY